MAQDVTGVWTGTLYNDTTRQYLRYELAISDDDGRLSGYSYTVFVIDGQENTGVKSIKIRHSASHYELEDEKLIYNNYTDPPAKGVRMFSQLSLTEEDTTLTLSGPWKTNQTSHYKSITGTILLHRKKDVYQSRLVPKLQQLGVAPTLSFMKLIPPPPGNQVVAAVSGSNEDQAVPEKVDAGAPTGAGTVTAVTKTPLRAVDTLRRDQGQPFAQQPAHTMPAAPGRKDSISQVVVNRKPEPFPDRVRTSGTKVLASRTAIIDKTSVPVNDANPQKMTPPQPVAAADLQSRTIETVRQVFIKNDSLRLTLYDNGEIDGDTVSVLLNGHVIWPLQGLTANGNSKTIYLTPEMGDSLELIMYAENLGSIPPNTGLLVVHDGEDAYEIRFSGDLEKNAAIILRRKNK